MLDRQMVDAIERYHDDLAIGETRVHTRINDGEGQSGRAYRIVVTRIDPDPAKQGQPDA